MKRVFIIPVFILLFNACNEAIEKPEAQQDNTAPFEVLTLNTNRIYKHLEGEIDKIPYALEMYIDDTTISGTMYNLIDEEPFLFYGTLHSDSIRIEKMKNRKVENIEDEVEMILLGKCNGSVYTNHEQHKNNEPTFLFTETYAHGSIPFTMYKKIDSIQDPVTKLWFVHSSCESIITDKKSINDAIYLLAGDSTYHGDMKNFIDNSLQYALPDDTTELSIMRSLPYEFVSHVGIAYNRVNRLVLYFTNYSYTGGAHGYSFTNYGTINTQSEKTIRYKDILSLRDSIKLYDLLEKNLRYRWNIKNNEDLDVVCFDKHPKLVNENYYITPKGINFEYNSYEIAGYAFGPIELHVNLEEIKKP